MMLPQQKGYFWKKAQQCCRASFTAPLGQVKALGTQEKDGEVHVLNIKSSSGYQLPSQEINALHLCLTDISHSQSTSLLSCLFSFFQGPKQEMCNFYSFHNGQFEL